jgi:hypothetical protein
MDTTPQPTSQRFQVSLNRDLGLFSASEERLLDQSLFGSIPQRVAEEALSTVLMVKSHDPVKFGLRRWLMRPRRLSKSN